MANIYLMIGIPGSGKSTFCKKCLSEATAPVEYVSRDEIRFSLLKSNDSYFSKEKEVLKIFYSRINKALSEGKDVYIDQTSTTLAGRRKLFTHIYGYNNVFAIWFDVPLETCLKRNETRSGRAYVPPHEIINMYDNFCPPTYKENFDMIVKSNGVDETLTGLYDG